MDSDHTLTSLTADIVAAYLAGNHVTVDDPPGPIGAVSRTVAGLGEPVEPAPEPVTGPSPGRIRKSIRPDALISFEDGKPYKQLKRNLRLLGLSPDQYRAKWGLAADYPMVASTSSEQRWAMAKARGLGVRTKPRKAPSGKTNYGYGNLPCGLDKSVQTRSRGLPSRCKLQFDFSLDRHRDWPYAVSSRRYS